MTFEAFNKLPLVTQLDQVLHGYKVLAAAGCETEFLQFAGQFEEVRKRGREAELRANELGEALTKAEAEKNALMIKLKHARRQVDVEIRQRQKAEQDRDELDQQIMLVRDLLFTDESGASVPLNEEQQRKLDFLNSSRFVSPRGGRGTSNRRLQPIDETGSILSNYSDFDFDETEDDLDATTLRNGKRLKRLRAAEARAHYHDDDATTNKRHCYDRNNQAHNTSYQAAVGGDNIYLNKDQQLRCTVDGPANLRIEKLEKSFTKPAPHQGRRRQSREHRRRSAGITSESETAPSDVDNFWSGAPEPRAQPGSVMNTPTKKAKSHDMVLKACVIVKETCKPCGKRIQFGKRAYKCADCRLVAHPECEYLAGDFGCDPSQYSPSSASSQEKLNLGSLEDFLQSNESPMVPPILYHSIREIERRGMEEVGLYRIPGMVRAVRELKEKFLKGKNQDLTKVQDVHTLCSLVKDFLRETLREPILTFKRRPAFAQAANKDNDSDMYQAMSMLPQANMDTLAYLMLHLQNILNSPETRMGLEALSKAIGPSIVGYSCEEPSIEELQSCASTQERIVTRLLNLPGDYYSNVVQRKMRPNRNALTDVAGTPEKGIARSTRARRMGDRNVSTASLQAPESTLLGPVGSSPRKTPSSSSLAERARKYLGTPFGKSKRKDGYFESPTLG